MSPPRVSNNFSVATETDEARQSVYKDFYLPAVTALNEACLPFLVGGAYAFERFTGIERDLKDFALFFRPTDCRRCWTSSQRSAIKPIWRFLIGWGKPFAGNITSTLFLTPAME